ncbi:hypothetical protein BKA80DRAFT_68681 [Phyllosticta citrichinensis]
MSSQGLSVHIFLFMVINIMSYVCIERSLFTLGFNSMEKQNQKVLHGVGRRLFSSKSSQGLLMQPATPLSPFFWKSRHSPEPVPHCFVFVTIIIITALEGVCSGQQEENEMEEIPPTGQSITRSVDVHTWHRKELFTGLQCFFFAFKGMSTLLRWRALAEPWRCSVADRLALRFRKRGFGALAPRWGNVVVMASRAGRRGGVSSGRERASVVVACRRSTGTWTSQHKVNLMQAFIHSVARSKKQDRRRRRFPPSQTTVSG